MTDLQHDVRIQQDDAPVPTPSRRRRLPLAISLALGAAVLGWEFRDTLQDLLSGIGLSTILLLACVGMHFLMHRGHDGHGKGGS